MDFFYHIGRYFALLQAQHAARRETFGIRAPNICRDRQNWYQLSQHQRNYLVLFGAVMAARTSYNMSTPLLPDYLVGLGTRDAILLRFSSTILCLILMSKVGSNIASEIGTMRVTEQIDALEIMGVNSANFIILPKIFTDRCIIPVIDDPRVWVSAFLADGWLASFLARSLPNNSFMAFSMHSYHIMSSIA